MRDVVGVNVDYTTSTYGLTDDDGNPLTDDSGVRIVSDDARTLNPDLNDAFDAIVASSHTLAVRADVLFNRDVIAENLAVTGGSVTWDRTASILASCEVTIADPERIPVSATDILTPYGYELQLWRGVQAGGGQILVPLGVFPIQRSSVDGVTFLSSISGKDRSQLVSDAIFEETYQVASSTNYATAVEALISDGVDGLEYLFPSTTFNAPTLTFEPDVNRWNDGAQRMARSIGNEILFDGLGRCIMRPEPTFEDTPAATISEGVNLLSMNVTLDRGPAYNKVIATSSNASLGESFSGSATDDDPSSPTYYDGPFGRKARRYSSPFLASDAQCTSAAAAILASNLGVAEGVEAQILPNPRLEPSDVVQGVREALGIDGLFIIDSMTIGLTADSPMTVTLRSQQVAS